MFKLLRWIKFQANATPIDVLHSPFVFRLYNKALRKSAIPKVELFVSQKALTSNQKRICNAVFEQLNYQQAVFSSNSFDHSTDMFIWNSEDDVSVANAFLSILHNAGVLVVLNPHNNHLTEQSTNELLKHPKARVIVDVFEMLLIFCRQEQAAQYFRLRI
jgi:hypothetical protein